MHRASGATVDQGTYGYWWSQGATSNTNARLLFITGNYTDPENGTYKTTGLPVRCVAFFFFREKLATKAPPASMIYFINSHSHCRIRAS
ncbi:hypothetical protein IJU22_00590 [Candidatus Saccharibacteria bacterium]|nr:hypothetical protein [Candidatus Saccharibacteria bacterium]